MATIRGRDIDSNILNLGSDCKLNLEGLIRASEVFWELQNKLITDWTVGDLHMTCQSLIRILENDVFRNIQYSVELFEEQVNNLSYYNQTSPANEDMELFEELQKRVIALNELFREELKNTYFYLPELPRLEVEKWFLGNIILDYEKSNLLPRNVHKILLEAGRCFLFKQYDACAVMSMCATEAMLRECYYRIEKKPPGNNWFDILKDIEPKIDKIIYSKLHAARLYRNALVHPSDDIIKGDKRKSEEIFMLAINIILDLLDHLCKRKIALSVIVCLENEELFFSPDIIVSLWLLHRNKEGIGKLIYIDSSDSDDYSRKDFTYSLGIGGYIYGRGDGFSYAQTVANTLSLKSDFASTNLIQYCQQNKLKYPFFNSNVYSLPSYYYTLEGIIEAIQKKCDHSKDDKLDFCLKLFKILDSIDNLSLDPYKLEELNTIQVSEYQEAIKNLRDSRAAEYARDAKETVKRSNCCGAIALVDGIEFDSLAIFLFDDNDGKYDFIIFTDGYSQVFFETRTEILQTKDFINIIRTEINIPVNCFEERDKKVQSKNSVTVRLSVAQLKSWIIKYLSLPVLGRG